MGNIMEKIRYIVQEAFASANTEEREKRLRSLMDAYIRTLEKRIAQNEGLG